MRGEFDTFRREWKQRQFWTDKLPRYLSEKLRRMPRQLPTIPFRWLGWFYWHRVVGEPLYLPEEDWDTCIVLDACRFDTFESVNEREGTLESRVAPGSQTGKFLQANFPPDSTHGDIVYVNGNPRLAAEEYGEFHDIIHVWENQWDEQFRTVLPAAMCEAALDVHEQYPDKRILVHFIQPHIPFIGDTAREIPNGAKIQTKVDGITDREKKAYDAVAAGDISSELPRKAYRESLSLALNEVYGLVDAVEGKIVVTADHGELLGERSASFFGNSGSSYSRWGHPSNTPLKQLVKIPWWVPPHDARRTVTEGQVRSSVETDATREQLEALGYR
jgi:hypothetical protein